MNCLDCYGSGRYEDSEKLCPDCLGTGLRHYPPEQILDLPQVFLKTEGPEFAETLAELGWTYWDLYPEDRPRFVGWSLPEGPSRDIEWAATERAA